MDAQTKICLMCAETIQLVATTCEYCGARFEVISNGYCKNCHTYDFTLPLDLEASQLLNRIAADIGVTIGFSTRWCLQCKNGDLSAQPGGGKLQTLRQAGVQDGDILPFWEE